ncbi:MAG: ATP-grasp domain-containing protein, partial [Pseudomonadota bacterium]
HKVVPFVGDLVPEPEIADPNNVILFGAYTLRHFAARYGLRPGTFVIRPFLGEVPWRPFLLNGEGVRTMPLQDVPTQVAEDGRAWFLRPVADGKEVAGRVMGASEIRALAAQVLALSDDEIPCGSLRHDTELLLAPPARIFKEWRVWVVNDRVVSWSLYKEGPRVTYRAEIDDDARAFAEQVIAANPGYAPAYVLDICRAKAGLRLLETNCINAAGFYAADLNALVAALEECATGLRLTNRHRPR